MEHTNLVCKIKEEFIMKILKVNEKFTYPDWPHGFNKRCILDVWIDYKNKFGYRLVYQTTLNERKAASKMGTYSSFLWLAEHDNDLYIIRMSSWDAKLSIQGYGAKTPEIELDEKMTNRIKAQLPIIQEFQNAWAIRRERKKALNY